eukprot:COSAG02_NODE_3115_length_7335_cov_2.741017_8_plen_387_part_00
MFALNNWSAVPNAEWDSYAMDSAVRPPPAPPAPPPAPKSGSSTPPNLHEIECAVHAYAYEFGTKNVPKATAALHDALNLQDCTAPEVVAQVSAATERAQATVAALQPRVFDRATTIHVAKSGSDATGTGSASAPFATLEKAQAAARAATKPVTVSVGAGKYFLNSTLTLTAADSGVTWAAAAGEAVILSGGVLLKPVWKPSPSNPKILEAKLSEPNLISDDERSFWAAAEQTSSRPDPEAPHQWGSPPAKWNTLHVDGVRQVRARYPNGNPQDNTGRCFSAEQHPSEGCLVGPHSSCRFMHSGHVIPLRLLACTWPRATYRRKAQLGRSREANPSTLTKVGSIGIKRRLRVGLLATVEHTELSSACVAEEKYDGVVWPSMSNSRAI